MSLAERVASIEVETRGAKVLTIDIERLPGRAKVEHRGLTIEGDFWDLSSWKHILGYRIHPDKVIEHPRTICGAWKWYDSKRVEFASEWDDGADGMHQRMWDAYDQADIVVGHNIDGFDSKKLKSAWWLMGLPEPSPFKSLDTLKIARKELGEESNTLDALCKRAGLVSKTDRYSVEVARAAVAGVKAKQKQIKAYNVGDIHATEAFLNSLRGRIPNHPFMGALDDTVGRCNQCNSADLEATGTVSVSTAGRIRYKGYRCRNCGGNLASVFHSRAANIRGVR